MNFHRPLHFLLAFLTSFLTFSIVSAKSQVDIAVYQVNQLELCSRSAYWEDKQGESSIQEVISHFKSGDFKEIDKADKNLGFSASTFWMRIPLQFKENQAVNFILEAGRPTTNRIRLWQQQKNGLWTSVAKGDALQRIKPEAHFNPNLFELTLYPNHNNTIYLQFESQGDIAMLSASLFSPSEFQRREQREQLFLGVFLGIMLFAIFSNLFLYYALKEKSYLWYVWYVLSIALLQVSLEGYASTVLFTFDSFIADRSIIFLTSASIFFVLLYTKTFLDLSSLTNKWPASAVNTTMGIALLGALLAFADGYPYKLSLILVNLSGFLSFLCLLYCLYAERKENRPKNLYFYAAFASLFAGTIVFVLANSNVIPLHFYTYNSLKIGNTVEVILLSLSMADRFSRVQKEKEKAQKEAFEKLQEINRITDEINVRLEVEVAHRTKQLNQQKYELEKKNKDITDSILYAATLQESVMPELNLLKNLLPDAFILYLPKDIVSGDFYWFGIHSEKIYFAAADCTGHGVPGAFMSILGIDIFDRLLREKNPPSTDWMLEQLDQQVSRAFKENASLLLHEHGMDVALCCFSPLTKTLEFCGAGRPLYLRNRIGTIKRIDGNKRSIGSKIRRDKVFEKQTFSIQESTWVYLQSDGFTDQFGGVENKKLHRHSYESFLANLGEMNGEMQNKAFMNFLSEWKRDQEQVDDILVMGVKLE